MMKLFLLVSLMLIHINVNAEESEVESYVKEIFEIPPVKTHADSVKAELIIPPGLFYDTMWADVYYERLWIGDDGGRHGYGVGAIVSFDLNGDDARVELERGRVPLYIDSTIAPPDFGRLANKVLITTQPAPEFEGALQNHFIFAIDRGQELGGEIVCVFPTTEYGTSHLATELTPGPDNSPFDGFIYAGASGNRSIIKVDQDGNCTPFVEDMPGWPLGIGWSPDGRHLLVGLKVAEANYSNNPEDKGGSVIVRVDENGNIVGKPIASGFTMPTGFDYAPKEWGPYAGKLFVSDARDWQNPTPRNMAVKGDSMIYMVKEDGSLVPFVEGIRNPVGIKFYKNMAFVSDIGGDYISGRAMADGAVFKLTYLGQ